MGAGAAVVVVAAVVGGAVVVGRRVVVVGLGALVVGAALVAGRVVGGVVAGEDRAVVGADVWSRRVELVVVDGRTVVSGGPTPAAAAAVVGAGHGRSPQADGGPDRPTAWSARTTTIPAVAIAVATQ